MSRSSNKKVFKNEVSIVLYLWAGASFILSPLFERRWLSHFFQAFVTRKIVEIIVSYELSKPPMYFMHHTPYQCLSRALLSALQGFLFIAIMHEHQNYSFHIYTEIGTFQRQVSIQVQQHTGNFPNSAGDLLIR